jgi:hypothetical protein
MKGAKEINYLVSAFLLFVMPNTGIAQGDIDELTVLVRPVEINDVLINPGIGFTTFQRFNGDSLNPGLGWTEGFPILYQDFEGDLTNKNYPQTSIAYFRVNWRFLETEPGIYNWEMIDKALKTAAERGQTLMLRISPYEGDKEKDVPDWYREMVGPEPDNITGKHWRVDPEDPRYLQYFGGMIKSLGDRYDGHPDLESVDISFIGYWGEGSGGHLLTDKTRIALINCYLDHFKKTHLIFQPLNGDAPDAGVLVRGLPIAASWPGGIDNGTGPQMRNLGWRFDCLGDLNFWPEWRMNHMMDIYPRDIVKSGMAEAWKKAPVSMEICGTFLRWKQKQKYDEEDVKYIFDQALKWHISTFNAKSSAVPTEWRPLVDEWLKRMGYRFVLRKFTYPSIIAPHGQIAITTWWENKGVAPVYRDYRFAIRIRNKQREKILLTDADLKQWLPGDIIYEEKVYLPYDFPEGTYDVEVGIVSPETLQPCIKLAISGVDENGWYPMGKMDVRQLEGPQPGSKAK